MKRGENLIIYISFSFTAAQANATVNATSSQNIGHIIDGEEIETKHQPGNMLPPQQGHGSLGTHSQPTHPLQTHQQVNSFNQLLRYLGMETRFYSTNFVVALSI